MEKIKTPEGIYDKIKGIVVAGEYVDENDNKVDFNFEQWFISELTEFGKQQYNQAVLDGGSFTVDDIRKAFEGGRSSVEAEIGYEHFGDMEAYPRKKIVKSFKQWMHENYRQLVNSKKQKTKNQCLN